MLLIANNSFYKARPSPFGEGMGVWFLSFSPPPPKYIFTSINDKSINVNFETALEISWRTKNPRKALAIRADAVYNHHPLDGLSRQQQR